jgi:hypothetical protein
VSQKSFALIQLSETPTPRIRVAQFVGSAGHYLCDAHFNSFSIYIAPGFPRPFNFAMLDWGNRSCLQRFALVFTGFTLAIILICLTANIVLTIEATRETWFVRCRSCTRNGGDTVCGEECCNGCGWSIKFLFYLLRAITMLFCALAVVAEFPQLACFRRSLMVFKYYCGRGAMHVFVGVLTLTGNLAADNADAGWAFSAVGWLAVALGVMNMMLSCLCFQEYSEVQQQHKLAQLEEGEDKLGGTGPTDNNAGAHTPQSGYRI